MEIVKAGLLIVAALGSTWVAREATGALFGVTEPQLLLQSGELAAQAPATQAPATGATTAPAPVPEMSREEMDAEFRRAQAEMAGGNATELKEFRPTKPLPADLPVALPSDI